MGSLSLRESLIGAWNWSALSSAMWRPGSRPTCWANVRGGSSSIPRTDICPPSCKVRRACHSEEGDLLRGSHEEYVAAGSSYIAYSGRFFVDEVKRSLSHEMAVSFFPNWLGQRQVRLVEVDSERLQLSTDGPQRFNGTLKTAKISWRRAKPNF